MQNQDSPSPSWTVIGADRDPRRIAGAVSAGTSVLIAGPLGSGRSHLLRIVASELVARGADPVTIRPSPSLRSVGFGAVEASADPRSALLRGDLDDDVDPLFLIVDDAEELDDQSAEAIVRGMHRGRVVAAMALEVPRAHAAGAGASEPSSTRLVDLWLQGFVERIDLAELTRDDAERLIDAFPNTQNFDAVTRAVIIDRADGSRILLRELAARAATALSDRRDPIAAVQEPPRHGRLRDALSAHVGRIGRDERMALAILGRVPGIDNADAIRFVSSSAVASLVSAGLIHDDGTARRRLFANAALAHESEHQLPEGTLEQTLDRASDRMLGSEGAWWSPPLAVWIAQRWHGEHHALAAVSPRIRACAVLDAARNANDSGQPTLALAFSRMLAADDRSPAIRLEGAHAEAIMARTHAAQIDLGDFAHDRPTLRRFLRLRGHIAAAYAPSSLDALMTVIPEGAADDGDSAREPIDPEIDLALAERSAMQMAWNDTAAAAARADAHGADGSTRVRATVIAALSAIHRGRWTETTVLLDKARRLMTTPGAHPSIGSSERILALGVEILASQMAGVETLGLKDRLRIETLAASRERSTLGMSLAALATALLRARAGDVDRAMAELETSARLAINLPLGPCVPVVELTVARFFALLGRSDAARALLRRTDDASEDLPPLLRHERHLTQSCIHAADGQIDDAIALAEAACELSESTDSAMMFLRDAFQLAVLGAADDVLVQRMRHVADATDITAAQVLTDRVKNIVRKGGSATRRAPIDLLRISAPWSGAREQDEGSVVKEISTLALIQPTVRVVGEQLRDTADPETELTRRERQIATLLAEGLTNREIAEQLFLSVRTVESHVYQARMKLGARSRAELGRLVTLRRQDVGDGTVRR